MNIGIMCHSSCGGSVRIAVEKAASLALRGHAVYLFSRTPPFLASNDLPGVAMRTLFDNRPGDCPLVLKVDWPPVETESMIALILDVLREKRLDILHVHYAVPFASIAEEVKRRATGQALMLIATLHGTDVSVCGREPAVARRLAETLKNMQVLTTVSSSHARLAADVFGLAAEPLVIPNFVNTKQFYPGEFRSGRHRPRILHISNFRPIKDPQGIALIFATIRSKLEAELWLVGDGEAMGTMKRILKAQNLETAARFFGLCSDVAAIVRECDLLLMPSRSESFCIAALEAMACGLPVVASDVGGLAEVVQHNRTGMLFPPGDYASAAGFSVDILSRPAVYNSMRMASVERSRSFEQERIVSLYEDLYYRLVPNQVKPRG
jgi:L-malate glycosyltransferase